MINTARRNMFGDLYRLAEHYEAPPFQPGDIEGNAEWFVGAQKAQLVPFLQKYQSDPLAVKLAMAILDDASERAADMNRMEV